MERRYKHHQKRSKQLKMECINCNATTVGTINIKGKIFHVCGNNCAISYQKQCRRSFFLKNFIILQEQLEILIQTIDTKYSKIWKKVLICLNIIKDSIQKIETRKETTKKYDMLLAQFHVAMEIYENTTSQTYFDVCKFAKTIDELKDRVLSLCQG